MITLEKQVDVEVAKRKEKSSRHLYEKDGVIVRPSTVKDVHYLKYHLRQSDLLEIWSSHRHSPEEALMGGLDSTECLTVERGHPIAMFGVSALSFTSEKGSIWLLASDELTLIQRRFLKHSREFIDRMLGYHPILENYCDCRNEETIKWIKWLGGEFSEPEPYGYDGLPFAKFTFKRRE